MNTRNVIALIGDKGIGKASFLNALRSVENDSCLVAISDLNFDSIKIDQKLDILLCFAMDDSKSFSNVSDKWKPFVEKFMSENSAICNLYLLGLKSDAKREVHLQEIARCCGQIGAAEYFECSSKNFESCELVVKVVQDYVSIKSSLSPEIVSIPTIQAPVIEATVDSTIETPCKQENVVKLETAEVESGQRAEVSGDPKEGLEKPVIHLANSKVSSIKSFSPKVVETPEINHPMKENLVESPAPVSASTAQTSEPPKLESFSTLLPKIPDTSLLPSFPQTFLGLEEEFANFDFNKPLNPVPVESTPDRPRARMPIPTRELARTDKRSSVWGFLFSKKRSEPHFSQSCTNPVPYQQESSATTLKLEKKKGFFARFFG
jgi:GTPase SAR1 family protein